MLFNTISYFIFLSALFLLYYVLPGRFRPWLILLASFIFYLFSGTATVTVPVVIVLCTWFCGKMLARETVPGRKKLYFYSGLFVNLGLLFFFKYINFVIATAFDGYDLIAGLMQPGHTVSAPSSLTCIIVPLGISYVTFQAIGYLIEINRGNQPAENNLGLFAAYLMFFPKLLSGPIERAHNFLPQLQREHEFNYEEVVSGLKRILWGLFLKLVVANRLALYTDVVLNNAGDYSGATLFTASVFFTIQLFADFAGYTAMAIGSAQILGYTLMENFNSPFIARSVTEFWRRWHISLTTWVTDYIYNPMVIKYRDWNTWAVVFASMVTFLILGFWHGASWNFLIFGFLQGLALSLEFLSRKSRKKIRNKIPGWLNTVSGIAYTFLFFCFSTIFFKANTATDALLVVKRIVTGAGSSLYTGDTGIFIYSLLGIGILLLTGLRDQYFPTLQFTNSRNCYVRFFSLLIMLIYTVSFGVFDGSQFIYFKF
jgi:alginate O-acetyltransferase complex protein AlgI